MILAAPLPIPEDGFGFIVIVVFLVVGALRWFFSNILNRSQPSQNWDQEYNEQQPVHEQTSLSDLYEQARAEILERQGQMAADPEEVARQVGPNPGQRPAPPAARINTPPPLPAGSKPEPKISLSPPRPPQLSAKEKEALTSFRKNEQRQTKGASKQKMSAKELLASPSAARNAVILAEILGPPKGLQD